jgi:leader peptidase (prepilin peptidase) / N-methyltransferase
MTSGPASQCQLVAPAAVLRRSTAFFTFAGLYALVWLAALGIDGPNRPVFASLLIAAALIWASAIDLETYRLPDYLTLPLALAGIVAAPMMGSTMLVQGCAAAAGFLLLYAVARTYRALRGRDGLGLGDAKLLAAGAAWLGPDAIAWIVLGAAVMALTLVAGLHLIGRRYRMDDALPFGPFLALSIWMLWTHATF